MTFSIIGCIIDISNKSIIHSLIYQIIDGDTKMSTVYNKKYFTDLLEKLVLPLKEHYSEECANLYLGHTGAAFEDRTIPMEGFSRVLWGLVPLWSGGENIEDFSEIYAKGLSAGTNPNSKEYWGGFRNYDQKFVEIAAIAYGLLLAPDQAMETA